MRLHSLKILLYIPDREALLELVPFLNFMNIPRYNLQRSLIRNAKVVLLMRSELSTFRNSRAIFLLSN